MDLEYCYNQTQHMTLSHFMEDIDFIDAYNEFNIKSFNINELITFANKFSVSFSQKAFTAQNIFKYIRSNYSNRYHIIRDIKDKINADIYMLLMFYMRDIDNTIDIIKEINNFQISNFALIVYALYNGILLQKHIKIILRRLYEVCFNEDELHIIKQYLYDDNKLIKWLSHKTKWQSKLDALELTDYRKIIITSLFNATYPQINNKECLQVMSKYFTDELINTDLFVNEVCRYKLLTEDIINKLYDLNNIYLFDTLRLRAEQLHNHIQSLVVLHNLQDSYNIKERVYRDDRYYCD